MPGLNTVTTSIWEQCSRGSVPYTRVTTGRDASIVIEYAVSVVRGVLEDAICVVVDSYLNPLGGGKA